MMNALASRLNQTVQGVGKCHSVFEHVINLVFNEHPLISIIEEGYPTQPYGLMVKPEDFKQLKKHIQQEDACVKNGHLFIFGEISLLETQFYDSKIAELVQTSRRSPSLMIEWLKPYLVEKGSHNDLYQRVLESKHTDSLIDYGLSKLRKLNFIAEDFAYILGYGVGLTPSSDDLCVGYFALLQVMDRITDQSLASLYQWIIDKGERYTNQISLKFIQCVLQGTIEEDIAKCLNALLNHEHDDFIHQADALLNHGSSSGSDILLGIYLALQAIQRSQNG